MENIIITTYRGFSKVKGKSSLNELIANVQSSHYASRIEKIGRLIGEGNTKEAENVKRQLDFFTVTANYHECRLAHSIATYNDIITIDLDHLPEEELDRMRGLIEADETTLACFLTAKQHGFKVLAYPISLEAKRCRNELFQTPEITYCRLEEYHAEMYQLAREHYEELLGTEVDVSGKDLSRGIFASYDPKAFYSPRRVALIPELSLTIEAPEPVIKKTRKRAATESVGEISNHTCTEFNKCLNSTRRLMNYTEGSRNSFLFALGNKCFRKGLDETEVKQLAALKLGKDGDVDINTPIANAYTYTDKTERAKERKKKKKKIPPIELVIEYLDKTYAFRRNTVLDRLEMCELSQTGGNMFYAMRNKDFNSIFMNISRQGISYPLNNLKSVIDSNYSPEFNPFTHYFEGIEPWDGKTDYIQNLADTIQAEDQEYWREGFKRWIVALVASALRPGKANQQALVLHGAQGKGKSTWIRQLLPPELAEYYRNGMIDPGNKDDLLLLSTRLVINMEEFEGVKSGDIAELKRIIGQENVTIRKVYDTQAHLYPRRASFIGSTNNMQFLKDYGGNRRFLVIPVKQIDYHTRVNYKGVYAQALRLIEDGFRYWFEGNEIDNINSRNERHRMKDPLEENLFIYFRPVNDKDSEGKWLPAAAMLSTLSVFGRTQANAQSQQVLVQILERNGFKKRENSNGITEYGVVEFSQQEINENFKKKEEEKKEEEEKEKEEKDKENLLF